MWHLNYSIRFDITFEAILFSNFWGCKFGIVVPGQNISLFTNQEEKRERVLESEGEKIRGKKGYVTSWGAKKKRSQKIVSNSAIEFYTKAKGGHELNSNCRTSSQLESCVNTRSATPVPLHPFTSALNSFIGLMYDSFIFFLRPILSSENRLSPFKILASPLLERRSFQA